jgi:hypothetical protein
MAAGSWRLATAGDIAAGGTRLPGNADFVTVAPIYGEGRDNSRRPGLTINVNRPKIVLSGWEHPPVPVPPKQLKKTNLPTTVSVSTVMALRLLNCCTSAAGLAEGRQIDPSPAANDLPEETS